MYLTRHDTPTGPRWACDGSFLPNELDLSALLALPRAEMLARLAAQPQDAPAEGALLAPIDAAQEVWAAGVTYLRSREARRAELAVASVYDMVYDAQRPELF